jgi:choline dehydrogenase-like flavoprotein
MIRDLSEATPGALTADVLVSGGGIAGLLAATRLARRGVKVIVAESGGFRQLDETHPFNAVEQTGDIYMGADHGRFRCLGGTSTRWGGTMLPFLASDYTVESVGWDVQWPVTPDVFSPYQDEVETLFKLTKGPYDYPDMMLDAQGRPGDFLGRLAKWPPFRLRNVGILLADELRSSDGPEIWLNATATGFQMDAAGKLASVTFDSGSGNKLTVSAPETILAAGAIESTRLLLLADRQHDDRIFAPDDVLGRYFHDHIAARTGKLVNIDQARLNRIVGFRFEPGGVMRNLRFEPTGPLRDRSRIPAGYTYIQFANETPNGFVALREIYRKLQKRASPGIGDLIALARAMPWVSRAVWWRFIEKRLLFPDNADLDVITMIEQEPRADNRINLSPTLTDPFGLAQARIHWRINEGDAANLIATSQAFSTAWNGGNLAKFAKVEMDLPGDPRAALASGGGFYHPGGTIRMGRGASNGVVDSNLRAFRVPNLTVLTTAVFPTGGGANPTMTLMMATFRAADRLAEALKPVRQPKSAYINQP